MNRVMIHGGGIKRPRWAPRAAGFCGKVLASLALDNQELSVVFCNNEFIRNLNRRFRGKDEPTDVLSFSPGGEGDFFPEKRGGASVLGDMVISLDMLRETEKEFSSPPEEEIKRLLIHGILHLSGEDHAGTGEDEPMLVRQEQLLREFLEEKIF